MGAGISRDSGGGDIEDVTAQDHTDDIEVLAESAGLGSPAAVYNRLLSFGLLSRGDSRIVKKKEKRVRKRMDSEMVLRSSLSTEPNESQFRRKQLKCLQRELSLLSRSVDPNADLMAIREQVLHRVGSAFRRTLGHEKKNGKWYQATTEEKAEFIQLTLKGLSLPPHVLPKKTPAKKKAAKLKKRTLRTSPTPGSGTRQSPAQSEAKAETSESKAQPAATAEAERKSEIAESTALEVKAEEPESPAPNSVGAQVETNAEPPPAQAATSVAKGPAVADTTNGKKKEGEEKEKHKGEDSQKKNEKPKKKGPPPFAMDEKFIKEASAFAETLPEIRGATGITSTLHPEQCAGISGGPASAQNYIHLLEQRLEEDGRAGNPERLRMLLALRNRLESTVLRRNQARGGQGGNLGDFAGRVEMVSQELLRHLGSARGAGGIRDIDELEDMLISSRNLVSADIQDSRGPSFNIIRGSDSRGPSFNIIRGSPPGGHRPARTQMLMTESLPSRTPAPVSASDTKADSKQSPEDVESNEVKEQKEAKAPASTAQSAVPTQATTPATTTPATTTPAATPATTTPATPPPTTTQRATSPPATTQSAPATPAVVESKQPSTVLTTPASATTTPAVQEGTSPLPTPAAPTRTTTTLESKAEEKEEKKEGKESKEGKEAKTEAVAATPSIRTSLVATNAPRRVRNVSRSRSGSESEEVASQAEWKEAKKTKERKSKFKQSNVDCEYRCENLLVLVRDRLVKDTVQALEQLAGEAKAKPIVEVPKAFARTHPCARLLWFLQGDLYKKASGRNKKSHPDVELLLRHVKAVIELSERLLSLAKPLLVMADKGEIKKRKETKERKLETTPLVSPAVAASTILNNSFFKYLTPITLYTVFAGVLHPVYGCRFAQEILKDVTSILCTVDALVTRPENPNLSLDKKYMDRFAESSNLHSNPVVVETAHTYFTSEPDKVVTIPGATHLSIEFDPRCNTEQRRDFLTVTTPMGQPVCGELHGRPSNWPDVPVIVTGDTVNFQFRADSFNNYFGYRCLVTGYYLGESSRRDQKESAAAKIKKMIKSKMKSKVVEKSKTNAKPATTGDNKEGKDDKADEKEKEPKSITLSLPPPNWLLDLERTSAHVIGRCTRALSIGLPVSVAERKAHKWLASPLLAGGKEVKRGSADEDNDSMLKALIENTEGSVGAKLHAHMRGFIPRKPHDMMGGEAVQKTIRRFIAIVLKHLGLLPIAEDYGQNLQQGKKLNSPDSQQAVDREKLRKVWEQAQAFHLSVCSSYSRNKQDFYAKEEKMKETKQQWDEEELKEAQKLLTISGYCAPIDDKCHLLLSQQPFFAASDASRALLVSPPRLTRVSSAYKPSRGGNVHKSLTSLYSAFDVVQSSAGEGSSTLAEQTVAFDQLTELVKQFLSSSTPVAEFSKMMQIHQNRAIQRAKAVKALRDAICSLKLPSAVLGALSSWSTPFRQYSGYPRSSIESLAPRGSHYLRNIESSGPMAITRVHTEVTALYRELVKLLGEEKTPDAVKALSIDSWALDLLPHDHAFILKTGILAALEKIGAEDETKPNLLSRMANAATQLLCVNIMDCGPTVGREGAATNTLGKLQGVVLDKALGMVQTGLAEMQKLVKKLETARVTQLQLGHDFCVKAKTVEEKVMATVLAESMGQASTERKSRSLSLNESKPAAGAQKFLEIEARTYEALALAYTALGGFSTKASMAYLSTKPSLQLLMRVLEQGTLRMQRMVLRALRILLPRIPPTTLDRLTTASTWGSVASNDSKSEMARTAGPFIRTMFLHLGTAYVTREGSRPKCANPFAHRNGQAVLAHASNILAVLRTIFESEKKETENDTKRSVWASAWKKQVRALIDYGLKRMQKLVAEDRGAIDEDHQKAYPNDLPCIVAVLCILGGHSPQLVIGGRVENVRASTTEEEGMRETGDLIDLDRTSNRCRVRFDHNPSRVVECEATKIRPIDPVPFDPSKVNLTKEQLGVFGVFTRLLNEDTSKEIKRKEQEEKNREVEEAKRLEREAERARLEKEKATASWSCAACTFINPAACGSCSICGTSRPPQEVTVDKGKEKETEGKKKGEEPTVGSDVLLYRQLRSIALQALCSIMRSEAASQMLVGSTMLPALLGLATQPTALDSYKSVVQLHSEEDRVLEFLAQARDGLVDYSRVFKRKAKGNVLECSPFKGLPVQLPNALDTASSRSMTFVDDELAHVTFNATKSIGSVRANHAIPNSLLAFYYEIRIEEEGVLPELPAIPEEVKQDGASKMVDKGAKSDKADTVKAGPPKENKPNDNHWGIALGLYRAGMPMDGVPGSYSSYAYNATGELVSTVARVPLRQDFGPTFKTGDVLGCGWDMRKKRVYFTRNGQLIKPKDGSESAFAKVDGFFFPVVWCQNAGASVVVNFGQREWMYDFRNTLPPYYLQQLADAERKGDKKNWKASEAEIRRKTMAEELVVMMGIYPRELCEVALERCNDDLEHAANWLIENGRRELEIMTNNMIRASEILAESKQLEAAGVVQQGDSKAGGRTGEDSDDEDLAEWLVGSGVVSGDPSSRRRAAAASFLDDEIEQDVPVGVERKEIRREPDANARGGQHHQQQRHENIGEGEHVEMVYDNLRIEDIHPGQTLAVSPLVMSIVGENTLAPGAHRGHLQHVAGRTGLVANVEVNYKAVQILFTDIDKNTQHCLWLPLQVLQRPTNQWQDPCPMLAGEKWPVLGKRYLHIEQALSVRKVRNAVVGLVAQKWPSDVPFSLTQMGGSNAVMSILKLTAAEMLSTVLDDKVKAAGGGGGPAIPLLDAFREKILRIVMSEWEGIGCKINALPKTVTNPDLVHRAIKDGTFERESNRIAVSESKCPLILTLLQECIIHFAQSVHHPPPVLVFKSKHPYASHDEVREEVHIPGASKLLVTFDSRCHLGNDILTRLSFYRDHEYQDLISQNNGRGAARYPNFVVPGDRLWFKFTSGNNNGLWGYKFKVKPLEFRLDDQQALSSHNFELGRWLFQLFLTQMPQEVTERYIVELYDAVTLYVIQSRPSTKIKGVKLLIQFLLHVHRSPKLRLSLLLGRMARVPDFKKLKPLTQEMDAVMGSIDINRTIHSQTLQALMELLATADLVQKDFNVGKRNADKEDLAASGIRKVQMGDGKTIDVARVGSRRMRILDAKYGPALASASDKKNIDITVTLNTHLTRCGGTELVLPRNLKELSKIIAFSIDPATGRNKKLHLRYCIERQDYAGDGKIVTTVVKENLERTLIFLGTPAASKAGLEEGEPTHFVIRSDPSLFEKVVRISRFTLQVHSSFDMKEERKEKERKEGKEIKEGKEKGLAHSAPAWGKGTMMAPEEFMVEAARLWALTNGFLQLVPALGNGLELQQNTQSGFANPEYFGNQFTASMWIFLQKSPPKKGGQPRALLHRGYHVGSTSPAQQKIGFRRAQQDQSKIKFMIALGAKDNKLTIYADASGQPHIITTKKAVPLKRWMHLAVVCTGHSIEVYFDGTLEIKATLQRQMAGDRDPIVLGRPSPGFNLAGVPAPPTLGPAGKGITPSVEAMVKDVRWYVRALEKKDIETSINDSTTKKSGRRTSLKGFQLKGAGSDTETKRSLQGARLHPGHLKAIEALATEGRVRCEGKGSGELDPKVWEHWNGWTPKMDAQLIQLFTDIAEIDQKERGIARRGALPSLLNLTARRVAIPEKRLRSYHLLKDLSEQVVRMRFLFIQLLNVRISDILPMVDFSQALSTWSLAHRLSMLSHLIFLEIKSIAWSHILQQTSNGRGHYINVNRPRALKAQERGDRSGRKSVFFQMYLQMHFSKPSILRTDNRPWVVSYQGFGGQDAGGLFRDSVSTVCSELQSKWVPLFIPVPNSRGEGVGDNQEKWLPNPSSKSALHMSMYAFVGKLMGVAIRGKHMLNLDLPSLVWKPLVGEAVTMADVKAIDVISQGQIEHLSKPGITKEVFSSVVPEKYVMVGYDGKEAEVKEGGASIATSWEAREEYVRLLRETKLNEVKAHTQAIRKGLGTIVPIQLLPLFTWQELEMMVCGKREIDIDYLKANTRYRAPVKETDAHVKMLWEVLREFSHEERRLFLRFVWGQSRLPYNPADFKQKFEILSSRDNTNGALPVSHTCFFSVELPRYTKKSAMREKILYAIVNCQSIDTDHAANNVDWDDE